PRWAAPARQNLTLWQSSPALAGVREAPALAQLPRRERQAWQHFWADVTDLLRQADQAAKGKNGWLASGGEQAAPKPAREPISSGVFFSTRSRSSAGHQQG